MKYETSHNINRFYPRDAMIAGLWPYVCVRVCLSVTSQCSVETDERIELALGMGASFRLFYTVLKGSLGTCTSKGTSLWNFVPNAGLRKVCFGIWLSKRLIDLAPQGGPLECDKLDYRRSTKLTIPPSSDNFITMISELCLPHHFVARVY